MEIYEEPLTRQQREELEAIVSPFTQILRAVLFVLFVLVVGTMCRALQFLITDNGVWWLIPTAAVSIGLYTRAGRWTGGRELRARIREDLNAGSVIVTVLEPSAVVAVDELEDEGPAFIIETEHDGSFLLSGQELERYRRRQFPWTKIGVIETARSKRFIGLKRLGDPVAVTRTRDPFTYDQARALGCFDAAFIALDDAKMQLLADGVPNSAR